METREVLGLDDLGREMVRMSTTDSSGDFGTHVTMAHDKRTGVWEVVDQRTVTDMWEMVELRTAQADAAFMSSVKRQTSKAMAMTRGMGKSWPSQLLYESGGYLKRAQRAVQTDRHNEQMKLYNSLTVDSMLTMDFSAMGKRALALVDEVTSNVVSSTSKGDWNVDQIHDATYLNLETDNKPSEPWFSKLKQKFKQRKPQPNRGPVGKKDWK